jgi:purine-binding chemotaxis protein CheW
MATTTATDSDAPTERQGVVFRLGETAYSIDIRYVDEIVERGTLTPLPNTADHFEGVMDLRGETTTIFNPRRYFDLERADREADRILILEQGDGTVGWIVDSVERVIEYTTEAIESEMSDGAVEGVLRRDDDFIIVVDPSVVEDTR